MRLLFHIPFRPSEAYASIPPLWAWGQCTLLAGLAFGLLLTALFAWKLSAYVWALPIVLVGVGAVIWLFQRPVLNVFVALAAFVIISGYSEGLQAYEAVYGLYFIAALAYWFARKAASEAYRFLQAPEDTALMCFLLFAAVSISWGLLYGAELQAIMGEALVLIMFAFYFPIKEACSRSRRATGIVLAIVVWFAIFTSIRNVIEYLSSLRSATQLYHIMLGRVPLNEVVLMMSALGFVVLLLYARRWRNIIFFACCFSVVFIGLILTQSRGYWAAFLFGIIVLFILIDRRRKVRVLLFLSGGMGIAAVLAVVFLGDSLAIISIAILERFTSLGTAITQDLSLVNRFYETAVVSDYIRDNPIIGYGMGSSYHYFHIIVDATRDWTFIHNGYAGLWFKYGLVGVVLMGVFWGRSVYNGIRLFRLESAPVLLRLTGLCAAICLLAQTVVANTANPFLLSDCTLMIGLWGALASGGLAYMRGRGAAAAPGARRVL